MERVPELQNGPLYIGSLVATALYACFLLQTVRYFRVKDKTNKWPIVGLAGWIVCTETTGVILMIHQIYHVLCFSSLGPNPKFTFPTTGTASPLFSVLTTISVQLFFATWIWFLARAQSKKWPLAIPFIIFLLTLAQLGAVIAIMISSTTARLDPRQFANNRKVVRLRLTCALAADILMSVSFSALLYPHRKSTSGSKKLIDSLIRNVLENGAIAILPALLQLVFNQTRANKDYIHFAFTYITARIHANIFVSALGARRRLQESEVSLTGGKSTVVAPESEVEKGASDSASSVDHKA